LKIKKLFFLLFGLTTLNGCIETTAFLGPAISVGTTGNVYQASLSYSTNRIINSATGKTPIEHVTNFFDPNDDFDGNLNLIVTDNINNVKESLKITKENLLPFKIKKKSEKVVNLNPEDQFILF
tara:strand:- start:191 stop:562 length:372 start_codon:yes stop_codon:yes gene_type:complete